jgi:hypothetical protein
MDSDDLDEVDELETASVSAENLDDIAEKIRGAQPHWKTGEVLDFGGVRWRPHLIEPEEKAVLHVQGTERMRSFLTTRMRAAKEAGYRVVVAADLAALFNAEIVEFLGLIDAEVILADGDFEAEPLLLVTLLAIKSIKVTPAVRAVVGEYLWRTRRDGATNYARGRRFEALVTFLLSQIDDFEIYERNLRADTDELDVVVRVRRIEGRLWCESGVPFVLVEAKNYAKDGAPQKDLSLLITKLQSRRGRARLGLLISATGASQDASLQELKLAFTQFTIVVIGPEDIEGWIKANDADDYLDRLIGKAMLR